MPLSEALVWCAFFISIGIAFAGYCIGSGLSNITVEVHHED